MPDKKDFNPGPLGALEGILASEKADANSKRRAAESNESHPIVHNAPLHHREITKFTVHVHNLTPFNMIVDLDDLNSSWLVLRPGKIIHPNHFTTLVVGNENIKGDGRAPFVGGVGWSFEDGTKKMDGVMVFGVVWEVHAADGQDKVGRYWSEEKESGKFWNNFSSKSAQKYDDDKFSVVDYWVGFKE